MDGYVSKPIQFGRLIQVIEELTNTNPVSATGLPSLARRANERTLARRASKGKLTAVIRLTEQPVECELPNLLSRPDVLARVGGDTALLGEMVRLFLNDAPSLMQEIRDAVSHGDGLRLERAAHALKGSVSIFEASAAVEAAARLETIWATGDLGGANEACGQLEKEIDLLTSALAEFAATQKKQNSGQVLPHTLRSGAEQENAMSLL